VITKKDISKGAISNTHISKSADIDPSKLKGDKVGSILIADRDGKYVARKIRGDASLLPNGEFRVASTAPAGVVTEEEVRDAGAIIGRDIKTGSTLVGERDGTPKEVNVGTGSNAIPQRDSSGNLKAETADQATNADAAPYSGLTGTVPTWNQDTTGNATTATNADKLDAQDGSHYLDVENHTGSSSTSGDVITSYKPHKIFEVAATSSNTSNTPTTFDHSFGYIPDVTVYEDDACGNFTEIDTNVTNTTTTTSINVSEGGVSLKVVIK
jgi:hypothetical protein